MHVTAARVIDPIYLIGMGTDHPFDPDKLEKTLCQALRHIVSGPGNHEHLEGVWLYMESKEPDSRWSVGWKFRGGVDQAFRAEGTMRPADVRQKLPPAVVRVLRALSTMNLVIPSRGLIVPTASPV